MGDFSSNPAAPGIFLSKRQIDAVAGIRHFVPLFCILPDGQAHLIQTGFPAEAARSAPRGCSLPLPGSRLALPGAPGRICIRDVPAVSVKGNTFPLHRLSRYPIRYTLFRDWGTPKSLLLSTCHSTTIPQSVQRMEDGRKCPAPVMVKQSGNIFKQQIRRSFCRSQPGNFKEQGTSWIVESSTVSSNRKRLAGKSAAQQVEVGDAVWIGFSDIFTKPLSFCIEQGFIALVCLFVDFAMAYAGKPSGAGEPFPEPADAGEQVNISYGFLYHAPFEGFDESLKHNQWTSPLFS